MDVAGVTSDASLLEIDILRHNLKTDLSNLTANFDLSLAGHLVSLIIEGKHEDIIKEGSKLNLFSFSSDNIAELDDGIKKCVQNYLLGAEMPSRERQLIVLCIAVANLELFVQSNWIGPETTLSPASLFGESFIKHEQTGALADHIQAALTMDADVFNVTAKHSIYLYVARLILLQCKEQLAQCLTSNIWQLRCVRVHQSMLAERSPTLKTTAMELIEQISKNEQLIAKEEYSDIAIQFHLAAGHMCYFYYEPKQAKEHFNQAQKLCGLNINLTGVLGKRTRFQQNDISQLVLEVKHNDVTPPWSSERLTDIPKNVLLDDDTLLDSLPLVNKDTELLTPMSAIQQAVVLGLCYNHRHCKEISQILQEESEAFISAVLYRPQCWAVQTMALLMRSLWESHNTRKMQRAMSQMEELVSQYRRPEPKASERLYLIHTLNLPPINDVQLQLAAMYEKVGAIQAALEVYLRIEAWEEVIKCYAQLGKKEKADKLIREQLAVKEKPLLWCYLGDIHNNEEYYLKSWELSKGRFGRAQRSLAYLYLHQKQYEKALPCFEKSLQVNSLQIGVWFSYGCAALQVEQYDLAAKAFRRCVNLDADNFEAWSNLATAYIKSKQKVRAFTVLQEAIRCEFENWRLWENYLLVGIDIGEFGEVIQSYHRLLDLKDKHCDVEVLELLVKAIKNNLQDAAGENSIVHRQKALELFGRITSKIASNSAIWRLYAELISASKEELSQTEREKMLQYLQKAHRCATLAVNWEKDTKTCNEVLQQSVQLAKVYLECCTKVEDDGTACQILTSAKLMIKGVLSKVKQHQTDAMSGKIRDDVKLLYEELEEQLASVIKALEERKDLKT